MIGGLTVNIVAPLVVLLVVWLFGLPRRAWAKVSALVSSWRLERRLRQGPFDHDTIARSVQFYVRPSCSATDPSCEAEPAQALITPRESLFRVLDRFLRESTSKRKHLLLLADSGMGKTSFLLNYFAASDGGRAARRRSIYLISLASLNCDDLIDAIPEADRRGIDLFLDALDEDQKAYGRVRERVAELIRRCHQFKSVVITCRTQFFTSDDEIPVETGLYKVGPVPANESKAYSFRRLYLSPFDDDQIAEYLKNRYPGLLNVGRRRAAREIVDKIPSLAVRPMLLAHLPDIMDLRSDIEFPVDLYEAMVRAWLVRESTWVAPDILRVFSEKLALDLYFNREGRGAESILPDELAVLAKEWGINLDLGQLTGRSLLNRTSDGRYKFAHRSIMEFFVAEFLVGGDVGAPVEITDQIAQFVTQRLGCWDRDAVGIFAYSRVDLRPVSPERKLGMDTDESLFSSTRTTVNVTRLMTASVSAIGSSAVDMTFADAVISGNETATRTDAGAPQEVTLRFHPQPMGEVIVCRACLWFEKSVLLCSFSMRRRDLFLCMDVASDDELLAHDFILKGRYTANGLDRWSLQRRVQMSVAGSDASALPSLSSNPAVAFCDSSPEITQISYIREYLDGVGDAATFGILSPVPAFEARLEEGVILRGS